MIAHARPAPEAVARIVVLLLRLGGAITLLAFGAMLLPWSWMAATHRLLGLGTLPELPVIEYLNRTIAALYGFHGVLLLLVASDVRRYRPLVSYVIAMDVLFGAIALAVDLEAGLPWWWTAVEGPSLIAFGLLLWWFARALPGD